LQTFWKQRKKQEKEAKENKNIGKLAGFIVWGGESWGRGVWRGFGEEGLGRAAEKPVRAGRTASICIILFVYLYVCMYVCSLITRKRASR